MDKYYWVLFKVIKYGWKPNGISTGSSEILTQEVTGLHPLELQIQRKDMYGSEFLCEPPAGAKSREEYTLLNWKEITEQEYIDYKDHI